MESLRSGMFTPQKNTERGSFRVQSYNSHPLNPSAPEFTVSSAFGSGFPSPAPFTPPSSVAPPFSTPDSSGTPVVNMLPSSTPCSLHPNNSPNSQEWISPAKLYDAQEEQIRKEYSSRCVQYNEHMIAVFNLDPKTSKKELTDIFFPTGATDSIILDVKGFGNLRRRSGVVFFPLKDFALRAVEKMDNFAPQRQTQLLVVRYCGPDPAEETQTSESVSSSITEKDLRFLVNLLKESISENLQIPDRTFVSLHAVDPTSLDAVLQFTREKTPGTVECINWPPPSSYAHQCCATKLTNPAVRTAVLSFPSRTGASVFVSEVEQQVKASKVVLRAVLLEKESKKAVDGANSPSSLAVDSASFPLFSSANNTFSSARFPFGVRGSPSSALQILSPPLPSQNVNFFVDPASIQQNGSLTPFGITSLTDTTIISTSLTLPDLVSEISRVALGSVDPIAIGPLLNKLITYSEFSQKEAGDVSQLLGQAVRDPFRAETVRNVLSEMMISASKIGLSTSSLENKNLWFKTVGVNMLNIVVQKVFMHEVSRKVAGEVAVHCFFHGYLPSTPARFAVCALNRFEKTLQSERQEAEGGASVSDPSIVVSIVGVLKIMVELWGRIVNVADSDTAEFAQKMKVVLNLCEDVSDAHQKGDGRKKTMQLTPSARPTPRPVVLKTSPSSGSGNRREACHLPGVGFPPQVKLGLMDTSHGASSDVSTESSLLTANSTRKRHSLEHADGMKREERIECTLFLSSLPAKLTHPQIRRLLLHFGEINKVRVKSKTKHGNQKGSTPLGTFVEFSSKAEAKAMIDYFANVTEKNFSFLRLPPASGAAYFDDDTIAMLYATSALQARNEIREPHHSDAVYRMVHGFVPGEEAPASLKWTRVSRCTFGIEDQTLDISGNSTIPTTDASRKSEWTSDTFHSLLSDLPVEPIPPVEELDPLKRKNRYFSDDDMEDIFNTYLKNEPTEDAEEVNLDFSSAAHTPSPFTKQELDEYTNLSASYLLDNA